MKYRNKKTGTVYVTVDILKNTPSLAEVTTESCSQPYIVKVSNLEEAE